MTYSDRIRQAYVSSHPVARAAAPAPSPRAAVPQQPGMPTDYGGPAGTITGTDPGGGYGAPRAAGPDLGPGMALDPMRAAVPQQPGMPTGNPMGTSTGTDPGGGYGMPLSAPPFGQTPNPWTPPQSGRTDPAALSPYPTMQGNPFAKYLQDQQSSLDDYFSRRPY